MSSSEIKFTSDNRVDAIRESNIRKGLETVTSNISEMDIKTKSCKKEPQKRVVEQKYNKEDIANLARKIYRENVNPVVEEKKDDDKNVVVPDTIASRAHVKAMARSLAGLRNGGNSGRLAPLAGPNGGNTGTGAHCNNYFALTTSMTLEEYQAHLSSKFGLSTDTEEQEDYTPEYITEDEEEVEVNDYMAELESELLLLEDSSWVEIDKVMRRIAYDNNITPKQLHKEFKTEHGMIPDQWVKENVEIEVVGWFPLDEAVRINKIGQVYEVSFLFRGGTQRLKFFWPEVGYPTREEMQLACQKFWPGARLLAYYPSPDPVDNQYNAMVMVPALTENFELIPDDTWDFMSEEDTETYDMIAAEEGEPITPVYLTEEGHFEMVISDHDTGEERVVVFGEGKRGLWDNIHAKRKRGEKPAKPGDKDYPKTLNVEGKNPCWDGYKRKPGTKKFEKGSCVKEGEWKDPISHALDTDKKLMKLHTKDDKKKDKKDLKEDDMKGMSVSSGDKRSTESGAGLTAKGVAKYRAKNPGSKLKTAVTTPPSKLKPGSKAANRRKSFCARSRGWTGERGKAARRRWNC